MSVERPYVWTCDAQGCTVHATKNGPGLPKDWTYIAKANRPIEHRCHHCSTEKPR